MGCRTDGLSECEALEFGCGIADLNHRPQICRTRGG
jgi:hypothetical protein